MKKNKERIRVALWFLLFFLLIRTFYYIFYVAFFYIGGCSLLSRVGVSLEESSTMSGLFGGSAVSLLLSYNLFLKSKKMKTSHLASVLVLLVVLLAFSLLVRVRINLSF